MNFKDKTVLITGANKGIGLAILKKFLKYNANIIGTSTSSKGAKLIDNYLIKNKGNGFKLNLLIDNSIKNFFYKLNKNSIYPDIVINNAGIKNDKLLVNMTYKDWKSVINVNLNSIFYISKIVIKSMIKKKYGRIINISSLSGIVGNIGQVNYSTSKSGLIGFSRSLALELANKGITVNTVSPGFINTDMVKNINKKYINKIISKIPIKRFGEAKEIANLVLFLASNKSSYITGENININGGLYTI